MQLAVFVPLEPGVVPLVLLVVRLVHLAVAPASLRSAPTTPSNLFEFTSYFNQSNGLAASKAPSDIVQRR